MAKKKKEEEVVEAYEYPVYTDTQLIALDQELEKYRITKKLSNGEEVSYRDYLKWLESEGAMKNGAVVVKTLGERSFERPFLYEILTDKLRQLQSYRDRKAKAEKYRMADYDKMAEEIGTRVEVDN